MRKNTQSILYFWLHAVLFAALFLPPIFIPNHRSGSGDYHLTLTLLLFPFGTAAIGGIAAIFPSVPRTVRAAGMLVLWILVFHGLYFSGFHVLGGMLLYTAAYAIAFLLVRLAIRIVRSVREDYRRYLARHRQNP